MKALVAGPLKNNSFFAAYLTDQTFLKTLIKIGPFREHNTDPLFRYFGSVEHGFRVDTEPAILKNLIQIQPYREKKTDLSVPVFF